MQTPDRDQLKTAQQAYQNKELDQAETLLLQLVERKAAYADAYSLLGMVYYEQGRFAKAMEALEKSVSINPNYLEALMYLSVLYHDLGYYDKGKRHEKRLYQLPKLPGAKRIASPFRAKLANMHLEIGTIYYDLACYREALIEFDQALSLEAKYPDIRVKRALCLTHLEGPDAAIRVLKDIVKDHPKYARGHLELGILYYTLGKKDLARAAWQALLKIYPNHSNATIYLKMLNKPTQPSKVAKPVEPVKAAVAVKPVKAAQKTKTPAPVKKTASRSSVAKKIAVKAKKKR